MKVIRKQDEVEAFQYHYDLFMFLKWLVEDCGFSSLKATNRIEAYKQSLIFKLDDKGFKTRVITNEDWVVFDEGVFTVLTPEQFNQTYNN